MKAYLVTTGLLFAVIAAAHVLKTVDHWDRYSGDPSFYVTGPGLGLVAAALAAWAFRLWYGLGRSQSHT